MSNPARRTLIIMFLEHADTTNPHLHGLVLFQDGKSLGLVDRDRKVLSAWERAVKSGTIDMQEVYEPAGLARYITKECWSEKNYDSMMISSEFFGEASTNLRVPVATRVEASLVATITEAVNAAAQGELAERRSSSRLKAGGRSRRIAVTIFTSPRVEGGRTACQAVERDQSDRAVLAKPSALSEGPRTAESRRLQQPERPQRSVFSMTGSPNGRAKRSQEDRARPAIYVSFHVVA